MVDDDPRGPARSTGEGADAGAAPASAEPSAPAAASGPTDASAAPTASGGRRAAAAGGRIALGAVAVAAAVTTVAAVGLLAPPTLGAAPAGVVVTPAPGERSLVCPGGVLAAGGDADDLDAAPTPIGGAEVTATDASDLVPFGGGSGAPVELVAPGDAELAGAQAQEVAAESVAGLSATACLEPSGSAWLVGGAVTVGRATLVSVANPSDVDAEVTVRLWGESGEVSAPGMAGIVVPAGERRVLSLAGFAPGLASPVVEVTARGGRVVATLQHSIVRGLDPGGVETVAPAAAPATRLAIPGIRIVDSLGVTRTQGLAGWDDAATAIRLLAPGDVDGTATVSLVPESGDPAAAATFVLDLAAGVATDIPLTVGLDAESLAPPPDGRYSVVVDADVPVVAAVRASTAVDEGEPTGPRAAPPTDVAWFPAGAPLPDAVTVAVADAPSPLLSLANPGPSDRTVLVDDGATTTELVVPGGSSASLALDADAVVRLAGTTGLVAAVGFAAPGALASGAVPVPRPLAAPVVVHP